MIDGSVLEPILPGPTWYTKTDFSFSAFCTVFCRRPKKEDAASPRSHIPNWTMNRVQIIFADVLGAFVMGMQQERTRRSLDEAFSRRCKESTPLYTC